MRRRIRTSRPLEYACGHNVDFMWLAEGLAPDHSTLAEFFSKFRPELKLLFQQVCKIAMTMGLIRLGEVAFDGTRVKASNSRSVSHADHGHAGRALEAGRRADRADAFRSADRGSRRRRSDRRRSAWREAGDTVAAELADLKARQEKLKAALEIAQTLDDSRRQNGVDITKNPAQVPMTDSDSRMMPNKEGGFAPNFTPTCLTDGQSGFILDAAVINAVNEHPEALPAVDRTTAMCGESPENFLADGGMATGPIMAGLEQREITGFVPVKSNEPAADSPVRRDDLSVPVAEEQWSKLPLNPQGQLDKSNFVYVAARDEYVCPQGRVLSYESRETRNGGGPGSVVLNHYVSASCEGCPLVARCLSHATNTKRSVNAPPRAWRPSPANASSTAARGSPRSAAADSDTSKACWV